MKFKNRLFSTIPLKTELYVDVSFQDLTAFIIPLKLKSPTSYFFKDSEPTLPLRDCNQSVICREASKINSRMYDATLTSSQA
jgi:hypothetical protein